MKWVIAFLLLASVSLLIGWIYLYRSGQEVEEITITGYENPPDKPDDVLTDDSLTAKAVPPFDENLIDSRREGEWQINKSAAVFKLDVPLIKPGVDDELLTLHGSFKDAIRSAAVLSRYGELLPSVNLLDNKAKQFDDGLYAILDLSYYQGLGERLHSHVHWARRLYEKAGKDHVAAPFLAAGLELAGVKVPVADVAAKDNWLQRFVTNETVSKPISFYTWNSNLKDCFRFLRYFQQTFPAQDLRIPLALSALLAQDKALAAEYEKALDFYRKLTNPLTCLGLTDLDALAEPTAAQLIKVCRDKQILHEAVAVYPSSESREQLLFERLFPQNLPEDADLMQELIKRLRSGAIDLKPRPNSGWYDHQVYALEILLLPEKGPENNKQVLTKAYKQRLLEAFKALLTKRRETHVRQLGIAKGVMEEAPHLPDQVKPRFRIEPCPTYYVRTARAYAFLANFLEAAVGKEALQSLYGLRKEGKREMDLFHELQFMKDLFYGLYFLSLEDLGAKPDLAAEEVVDRNKTALVAENWLSYLREGKDKDLASETYVAVPIYIDMNRQRTRLWITLGVRLARLDTSYAVGPRLRMPNARDGWQQVERFNLGTANYLLAVDEAAEVELQGLKVLTRDELKAVCQREKTREAILKALKDR
jgi:hypothetical protein